MISPLEAPGAGQQPASGAEWGSRATMAMSTNRQTMDGGQEFEMLKTKLLQVPR